MKDKILNIVAEHCEGWKNCEELTEKLFALYNVGQQRELLVAYEKQHYTPSEWVLASEQCEKEIDNFLATNCG